MPEQFDHDDAEQQQHPCGVLLSSPEEPLPTKSIVTYMCSQCNENVQLDCRNVAGLRGEEDWAFLVLHKSDDPDCMPVDALEHFVVTVMHQTTAIAMNINNDNDLSIGEFVFWDQVNFLDV